jgi:Beta-lactamase enzyme family
MSGSSPPGRTGWRTWLVVASAVAAVAVLALAVAARDDGPGLFGALQSRSASTLPAPTTPVTPSSQPPRTADTSAATAKAAAVANISAMIRSVPDHAAFVAALNTTTRAQYLTGSTAGNWTASCYKLVLLETLLLQHQQQGTSITDDEAADATAAIEHSDNVAGYQLWLDVGRNPGMQQAMPTLGLTHAVAEGSDPTFTKLTGPDTLALLNNLVDPKSPLDAASRSFTLGLMRAVESDQRWGVGAAADPGTTFANKNGWLSIDDSNGPGESDDGRWVVNSLGIVTVAGQQVLLAVFTEHQPSFAAGVKLVETLAKAVRPLVAS